ncbi:PBS lyase [Streptomyces sp. NPDC015130]|uniref:PBS lyase n=1 Tax=Streptomyces sp. NPDC015130 TaxID=3364940 RepID=UPI0036F9542F
MFTGIDDVDWASMDHAYGDAADVPELLRGLASADAAEREAALDGMYGAVHHQGDVYDSTVACVPFLFELVATAGLPGRGEIVELLRSIDGDGRDPEEMDFWSDDEDEYAAWAELLARAESDTRARSGVLLDALADPDARLRRAVPGALVQLHGDPEEVLAVLRRRLTVERDGGVLRALAAAVGELGVRHQEFADTSGAVLADLLTDGNVPDDPGLRLSALVQIARCSPSGPLPERAVGIALDAMREAREAEEEYADEGSEGVEGEAGADVGTPTMISYLRRLKASGRGSVKAPWATELLGELHRALDDRVAERFALLEDQLRSPDWGQRREAIDMGGLLLTGWRGPHEESVRLLGEQLRESDHRIVRWAARELEWLYAIGGPAADALAARVAAGPEFLPQARWHETSYGAAVCALAARGDARAVPALADVLRFGEVPEDLGDWIGRTAPTASAALVPVLLRRLAGITPGKQPRRTGHLLKAAAATGVAEAAGPALLILRAPGDVTGPVLRDALRALAELGGPAREALPELRRLARDGDTQLRVHAAAALLAAGEEPESLLPALAAGLAADHWSGRVDALRLIARMGTGAAGLLPELRRLVASPEENGGWVAGFLATALWEAGRDAEESLPVLLHAWSEHVDNRPEVAGVWARMGAAARSAVPVVRDELAAVRRHDNTGGTGRMRYRCAADELLLAHGRALLEVGVD